jgi:transcriptional regulator with XRE-family HTH domain
MDYSKALKDLREKLLVTQEELAEMLGVSFASVNRWENKRHEPTIKAKRKIRDLCRKNGIKELD